MLQNRYQIIRELGDGGFGKTFLAEDTHMPSARRCVIKQLKPINDGSKIYQLIKDRFLREAAILEQLGGGSNQIPKLYAYFESNGQFYLVQEYIEGETLSEKLHKQGPISEDEVKDILVKILPVLDYVHHQHIVHRDIKPDNIIVRRADNLPVLIDFGAVKESMRTIVTGSGTAPHSSMVTDKSSIVIGTPGFMPSEQLSGRPVFSSDLYALGLTAIYLLTGKIPQELHSDPLTGEIAWKEHAPNVSPAFAAILDRTIQIHLRDRFPTANAMLDALNNGVVSTTVVSPSPYATVDSLPPTVVSPPAHNTYQSTQVVTPDSQRYYREDSRSSFDWQKTALVAALVGILLFGGGGLFIYLMIGLQRAEIARIDEERKEAEEEREKAEEEKTKKEEELQQLKEQQQQRTQVAETKKPQTVVVRERVVQESSNPSSSNLTPTVESSPSLPFQSACGSPNGSGSVWYRVLGPAGALNTVKNNFCGDAFVRSDGNLQVASFNSRSEAQNFAAALSSSSGYSFRVR